MTMGQRIRIRLACAALCLLALASLAPGSVTAQGCADYRALKGLPQSKPHTITSAVAPAPVTPVVRLTLYWAEGCGHCHEVLDGLLPRLQQQYGPQLEVRLIEVVSLEDVSAFFDLAEAYGYARGRASVPFLLIGDRALMGAEPIAAELPDLIATALAAGGTDWPAPPAQAAAGPVVATADGACGFAAPCAETGATATPPAESPAYRSPLVLAAASALGLALLVGGATSFWRWRHRGAPRGLAAPSSHDTSPIGSKHVQ